ncbi:hypothetical protein F2Q69_00036078 [Brassica cretica]|uniref:F-box domain-containing protein n=1 Tax=Brassica cretica TaxID=69181 RepID=A0A8S9SND1_BRACR|nr:hypothetical protein F2Q69_00036078 [Brassica cretica]
MEFFPLLELPEEIQAVMVERAARNSIQDLFGLKASSRSLKALAEGRGVYHFLDVLSVPWGLNMPSELLKACYAEGNTSTLHIKADAGYERAVYTHAMTRAIFWGEGKYLSRIPIESLDRIGKLVRSVKWAWGLWHTPEFKERMALFISHILPKFYSCQCGNPVERDCPCLWHIDVTKNDNMCPHCLWLKEIGLFLREFEPAELIVSLAKLNIFED